jgi:hypothetical protein
MNKFYANLMTQNRKRAHEATVNGDGCVTNGNKNEQSLSSSDTSPLSKRSLLTNNNNQTTKNLTSHVTSNGINGKQLVRLPTKSVKPTQSINLLNAPEELHYVANRSLK